MANREPIRYKKGWPREYENDPSLESLRKVSNSLRSDHQEDNPFMIIASAALEGYWLGAHKR